MTQSTEGLTASQNNARDDIRANAAEPPKNAPQHPATLASEAEKTMRWAIGMALACLLLHGCRHNPSLDAHLELMNAERRGLEDRLYELEYEYKAKVAELERCRQQNAGAPPQLERSPVERDEEAPPLDLTPPQIDPGEPQIQLPPANEGAELDPPAQIVPPRQLARRETHSSVARIAISSKFTGGIDLDEEPGDDGLAIGVEPRNESDEIVGVPGAIRIVVLDYARRGQGSQARVAEWELSVDEVRRFLDDSPADQGIRLHLLWPNSPPEHGRLRLHVRYVTSDGRKLDARRDVRVALPSKITQRWTPRSNGGRGSAAASLAQRPSPPEPGHLAHPQPDPPSPENGPLPAVPADAAETSDNGPQSPRPGWRPYR